MAQDRTPTSTPPDPSGSAVASIDPLASGRCRWLRRGWHGLRRAWSVITTPLPSSLRASPPPGTPWWKRVLYVIFVPHPDWVPPESRPPPPPPLSTEPPETKWLLGCVPWVLLLVLPAASLWLPSVLAGYGRALARHDEPALAAREAAYAAAYGTDTPAAVAREEALEALARDWEYTADFGPEWRSLRALKFDQVRWIDESADPTGIPWSGWGSALGPADSPAAKPVEPAPDADLPPAIAKLFPSAPIVTPAEEAYEALHTLGPHDRSTRQWYFTREFNGRDASHYQPGSLYYETARILSAHEASIARAVALGGPAVYPTADEYLDLLKRRDLDLPDWDWLARFLGYRLHEAAFRGDWLGFEQAASTLYALTDFVNPTFWGRADALIGEAVAQHGYTMPDATLLRLRAQVLERHARTYDVKREMQRWELQGRRWILTVIDQHQGRHFNWNEEERGYPIYLQEYAIHYPWIRWRMPQLVPDLGVTMQWQLRQPGSLDVPYQVEDSLVLQDDRYSYGPTTFNPRPIAEMSNVVDDTLCRVHTDQRLLIAAIDALLAWRASGAWPASLAALGDPDLRIDPYATPAAPLVSRIDDSGALRIWSIGWDRVSNGGLYVEDLPAGARDNDTMLRITPGSANPAEESRP